jgi:uncharacterized protein YfbU (UPF0304 family)
MIRHVPVLQQTTSTFSGFHALYNVKCLISALLSTTEYFKTLNILKLNSKVHFWKHYNSSLKIIKKCTNSYLISKEDKEEI